MPTPSRDGWGAVGPRACREHSRATSAVLYKHTRDAPRTLLQRHTRRPAHAIATTCHPCRPTPRSPPAPSQTPAQRVNFPAKVDSEPLLDYAEGMKQVMQISIRPNPRLQRRVRLVRGEGRGVST